MEAKDYERLNSYLNDAFMVLEYNDYFLLENILKISAINDAYLKFIDKHKLFHNTNENKLTYEEVYSLARQIIASIDKTYLNDYDDLIQSGKLDFSYNNEHNGCWFIHNGKLINIDREFNYNDVMYLVHEFIHYTNGKTKQSRNRYLLTEFLSIYFEIYALDYLMKLGIPKNEIGIFDRLNFAKMDAKGLYNYEVILLAYEKFGNIDDDTFNYLNRYYLNISKESFEKECQNLLNYITEKEEKYKANIMYVKEYKREDFIFELCRPVFNNYRYLLGTLMAYYARNYCKIEDIVYLNNHINDSDIGDLSLTILLKKIGIDISSKKFIEEALNSVESYIEEYSREKSR